MKVMNAISIVFLYPFTVYVAEVKKRISERKGCPRGERYTAPISEGPLEDEIVSARGAISDGRETPSTSRR
jgi:hypothetical protein